MNSSRQWTVVFVGDTNVGKTSIISRLCKEAPDDSIRPTVGSTNQIVTLSNNGHEYTLAIVDTAGQVTYRNLMPSYVRGADIAVIVFARDNQDSFENLPDWLTFLDEHVKGAHETILVCNKVDLAGGVDPVAAMRFAEKHEYSLAETSATTGQGIEILISLITAAADHKKDAVQPQRMEIERTTGPAKEGRCSC
jgi:small GTP-binding protein